MIRFIIAISAVIFAGHASADELKKESTPVPIVSTNDDTNENVVVQHDLANHMGWGDQQAVFRAPRNFRTKQLNEISPDTIEGESNSADN